MLGDELRCVVLRIPLVGAIGCKGEVGVAQRVFVVVEAAEVVVCGGVRCVALNDVEPYTACRGTIAVYGEVLDSLRMAIGVSECIGHSERIGILFHGRRLVGSGRCHEC